MSRTNTGSARSTWSVTTLCASQTAPMVAKLKGPDGKRAYIDIIDFMTFDEDGLITSMRAFWSPDAIRRD